MYFYLLILFNFFYIESVLAKGQQKNVKKNPARCIVNINTIIYIVDAKITKLCDIFSVS